MKKQAEIEAVIIEYMKGQVWEGAEQSLESEVNKEIFNAEVNEEMFFDEEIQQDIIEQVYKSFKENIPQDISNYLQNKKRQKWKENK